MHLRNPGASCREATPGLHVKAPYNVYFDKPWININRKGAYTVPHNHPGSF